MNGTTHMEFIDEMGSYEENISMSYEKEELKEVTEREKISWTYINSQDKSEGV